MEKINFLDKKLSKLSPEETIEAVKLGIKPAALFIIPIKNDLPFIEFNYPTTNISNGVISNNGVSTAYVYYKEGNEQIAKKIQELVTKMNEDFISNNIRPSDEYHIELGRLLGYTEEEINDFLQRK